uniref:Metalloendopeptidase n=1 Tax=Aceria tosichella TaxID=561515 RepID=A0A6G1SJD9_9ACAR
MADSRSLSRCLIFILGGLGLIVASVSSLPTKTPSEQRQQQQLNHSQQVSSEHDHHQASYNDDQDSLFLGLYNMFGGGNPSVTPNGQKLIEGDIVVPTTTSISGGSDGLQVISGRKAVPDTSLYWPNGEIIYTYHESITAGEMAVIEAAMQHWRQHTCLTFRQRQPSDLVFVRFRSDTQGCWSLVGRQVNSPNGYGQGQDVSIGQGCANLNVVVHEIGHVIGFFHEQSRSDRDQYIDIVWSNVLPGYALQFRKESDTNYGIPYDLTSTMQYPQWAFSKEIFEKSTIVAKNPAYQRFLSKNYPLSFRDRLIANQMYSCTTACASSASSCQNGGYMRASGGSTGLGGASCSCDCPPNYTGQQCETKLRSDYYPDLPCGGIINQPGIIETPGYPQRTQPFSNCMWDIQAPIGHKVSIKFEGFGFAPRFTKPGTKVINKCFNETVEIRLRNANIYDGDAYCGTDIAPGTVLKSDGPKAVIIITANDKMIGTGLKARVRFQSDSSPETDDEEDNEIDDGQTKPQTPQPPTQEVVTTTTSITTTRPEIPIYTTPTYTVQPPVVNTLPPILPPRPPPSVVTTSSLLEEYEKESKKTYPPVGPF